MVPFDDIIMTVKIDNTMHYGITQLLWVRIESDIIFVDFVHGHILGRPVR